MKYNEFTEALKGKQHKIDKNKNGKIDAHDFKLLQKEEEETVDRVERSDYKVSPSGRKSHKQIIFKMGDEELKEATVSKKDYSWGKMMTVHHGKDISYPLHPEHQKIVKNLRPSGEHSKAMYKDETGNQVHVTREDDKVHFVSHRTSGSKKTTVDYKHFDESVPAKNTDIADKSYLKDMGKKPTIKSDLKNFKNFLMGKKETMEAAEYDYKKAMKSDNPRIQKKGIGGAMDAASKRIKQTFKDVPRNSLEKPYKEEVENVEEGYYEKPASAYRRKGDEIGGGSSKNDVPFDGPYTKTKPAKNSDGTPQAPMSLARQLAKGAMKKQRNEEVELEEGSYNNPHKSVAAEIKAGTFKSYSPTAPVPDKKYIKGTPENKAYKATKKPINGHPTNVKEALKGDQHKIDKNKNGKIDAHDFKLLRKEEAEQIDELDQKTLKSYVNKNLKSGDTSDKRDEGLYRATNKIAKKQATSTLDKKVKTLGNKRPSETKNRYEYEASRSELKDRGIHHFAGRRTRTEEVELDEANHREFASQGKMHPDMAKHMSVGQEMDYYEHGTGDKVSGKVLKNDGKEVHIKQTHDSYDPKKKGTVHKFTVSSKLDEVAPPGFEGTVKAMKKHKEIDNPYALAWYMKNKGMKSHKEEFDDNGELITNMKSYKEFLESLDEVKMSDLPSRKVSGKYGTEYYKGEAEKDVKGYDDEDTTAKPAGEKRGRGRPAGSTSGARQKGTIAKRKGSGVEMTGYPVHLPNFK